jgi:hypothetical protein
LPGIRWTSHAEIWARLFLSPLVERPGIVTIPLKSLAAQHLQRGTLFAFDWSAGPSVTGQGWTQRVLRVLETSTDYLEQTMTVTAFDTGYSVIPPQAVPFLDQNGVRWYLRLSPLTTTLEFVSALLFPWISVGADRHWVTRVSPLGVTVYLYPSTAGAVLTETAQPGVGSGNALQVDLVDWSFRRWDVAVSDDAGYPAQVRERPSEGITPVAVTIH